MKQIVNKRIWGYLGRFSLIHVITYALIAVLFLNFQDLLPAAKRIALEFYQPYRLLGIKVILMQLVRGGGLALILYPVYDTIVRSERGGIIIFGVLWGIVLLGSVEPRPGSIEGMIYTKTTWIEHFVVLTAGAIQISLFSWLFLYWEKGKKRKLSTNGNRRD